RFRRTLSTGSTMLDAQLEIVPEGAELPGDVAFQLHDTYGFPLEVTQEVAAERGVQVDLAGFEAAMAEQRQRARDARKAAAGGEDLEPYQQLLEAVGPTDFIGREVFSTTARVLYATERAVVLDKTPFYAESGGQVGDTGEIIGPTGRARVVDTTYAVPGLVRHHIELVEGSIEIGQDVHAAIDVDRRDAIRRNHT